MDVDIEDILAELDRDTTAVDYSNNNYTQNSDNATTVFNSSYNQNKTDVKETNRPISNRNILHETISPEKDYNKLLTHWRNERFSPEVLPYPHALMSRMLMRIQEQMERLEIISMNFMENHTTATPVNGDGSASNTHTGNRPVNNNNMLPLLCMEAELERVKFVIRSYIRCRLSKVDKYSLYLRQINEQSQNSENESNILPLDELLSKEESEYHIKHSAILMRLFNNSILKHMPTELQAINDTEGSVNMIDEPDWNKFVFIRIRGPSDGNFELDPLLSKDSASKYHYSVTIPELNEDIELSIDSIYVMRYGVIKDLLKDEKIVLI